MKNIDANLNAETNYCGIWIDILGCAEASERWGVATPTDTLKERSEKPASPQLESRDSSSILRAASPLPSPLTAASLHFLFVGAIIEFRVRGGNQHFVWISAEHKSKGEHFDLRFGARPADEIDRADDICRFAVSALPAFEQCDVSVLESPLQCMEVVFDRIGNRHHGFLIYR